MLYFFCAIRCEAQPLIDHYWPMDLVMSKGGVDIYMSEDGQSVVCISGIGKTDMAYAAAVTFSLLPPDDSSCAFNVGICAGYKPGSLYIVDKVSDCDSGRELYPDILYDTGLESMEIRTVSRVINEGITEDVLYDMESSAFAEVCMRYMGPEKFALLKVVSDKGEGSVVTEGMATDLINNKIDIITKTASIYQAACAKADKPDYDLDPYSELFCCSASMSRELRALINYAIADGKDYEDLIKVMKEEAKLPASCRKDGKEMLGEFRRRLIFT